MIDMNKIDEMTCSEIDNLINILVEKAERKRELEELYPSMNSLLNKKLHDVLKIPERFEVSDSETDGMVYFYGKSIDIRKALKDGSDSYLYLFQFFDCKELETFVMTDIIINNIGDEELIPIEVRTSDECCGIIRHAIKIKDCKKDIVYLIFITKCNDEYILHKIDMFFSNIFLLNEPTGFIELNEGNSTSLDQRDVYYSVNLGEDKEVITDHRKMGKKVAEKIIEGLNEFRDKIIKKIF